MRNYEPLGRFLDHLQGDYWRPTFHELERLLEFELPAAARKSAVWWRNEVGPGRPHVDAWLDAGWTTTGVNIDKQTVTFRRGGGAQTLPSAKAVLGRAAQAAATLPQDRPLIVLSVSAGVAFVAGALVGMLITRR